MTLSDLNPEVIAFFEVEHLGPDWSLCQIRDQVFDLTSNRPIWPISDINASHIYLVLSFLYVGLAKKYFLYSAHVTNSCRLRFDCEGTTWHDIRSQIFLHRYIKNEWSTQYTRGY